MKCRISTELGEIIVDTDVIAKYAGTIAVECIGIVGMATKNSAAPVAVATPCCPAPVSAITLVFPIFFARRTCRMELM